MRRMKSSTLFLRTDGSLMLAKGDDTIELRLTPEQLLQLGMDCLQVAVGLAPMLLPAAAEVLAATDVPAQLTNAAGQAIASTNVVEAVPCRLN